MAEEAFTAVVVTLPTVAAEASTAAVVTLPTVAADTSTAAITAVDTTAGAEVTTAPMAGIGVTLATVMDGDSALALAGDPIGQHTRTLTGTANGGALLPIIILTVIIPILRLAMHTPIPTPGAAVPPRQIMARISTRTLRRDCRARPHRRTLARAL